MGEKVLAATLVSPRQVEIREYPMPEVSRILFGTQTPGKGSFLYEGRMSDE